jgi:hypothetical protein
MGHGASTSNPDEPHPPQDGSKSGHQDKVDHPGHAGHSSHSGGHSGGHMSHSGQSDSRDKYKPSTAQSNSNLSHPSLIGENHSSVGGGREDDPYIAPRKNSREHHVGDAKQLHFDDKNAKIGIDGLDATGAGISSARLKNMALGQPGYKDVSRHYDSTLGNIDFNKPGSITWNHDVPTETTSAKPVSSTPPVINPRGPPPRGSTPLAPGNAASAPPVRASQPPPRVAGALPIIAASHPVGGPVIAPSYAGALPIAAQPPLQQHNGTNAVPVIKALPPRKIAGGAHPLGPVGTYPVLAPSTLAAPTAPIDTAPVLHSAEGGHRGHAAVIVEPVARRRSAPKIEDDVVTPVSRGDSSCSVSSPKFAKTAVKVFSVDENGAVNKGGSSQSDLISNVLSATDSRRGSGNAGHSRPVSSNNLVVLGADASPTHAVPAELFGEPPKRIPVKPYPNSPVSAPLRRLDSDDAVFSFISPTASNSNIVIESAKPSNVPSLSLSLVSVPAPTSVPSYIVAGEAPIRLPGGVAPSHLTAGTKPNAWQKFLPSNPGPSSGQIMTPSPQNASGELPSHHSSGQIIGGGNNSFSSNSAGGRASVLPVLHIDVPTSSSSSTGGGQGAFSAGPGTNGLPPRSAGGPGIMVPVPGSAAGPGRLPPTSAPKPAASPHAVKETTDVKRNRAQLPAVMTHAKPTTGDWLKKRYIVNNYILLDTLGEGSYGEVNNEALCLYSLSDGSFCIKGTNV